MRTSRILLITLLGLAGCLGEKQKPDPPTDRASLSAIKLLSYDTTSAVLSVRGSLELEAMTNYNSVALHLRSDCSDSPVGTGLQEDFIAGGIQATVPAAQASRIYVATNTLNNCFFLGQYTPQYEAPPTPVLTSTSPVSPSQTVTTPALFGTAGGFAVNLEFFDDSACSNQVGTGTTNEFKTTGITITVAPNQTSHIYAVATEPFGNASACEEIGTYRHNTTGPPAPVYVSVSPLSPNKTSTTPAVKGTSSADTVTVKLFSDAACATELVSGAKADFEGAGLTITAADNAVTTVYAKAINADGDQSTCNYLTSYVHDTVAPATPVYASASPASPTAATLYPRIKGVATADTATVRIYNSVACVIPIGSGTKAEFEGLGVLATLTPNTTNTIYAADVDAAGNVGACVHMTDYTHDTLPPDPPVFSTTLPLSPNNLSTTPVVTGNASTDTVNVELYTDEFCTALAGAGTGDDLASPGITAAVPGNATTTIYGASFDEVGNKSSCAELTVYAHSTMPAPPPGFLQTVPSSPSRLSYTPYVIGTAPATVSSVRIYNDAACLTQIGSASRVTFSTIGIQVTLAPNSIFDIYAKSQDVYGNDSACTPLTSYTHNNIPPLNPSYVSTNPASPNNTTASPYVKGTVVQNPASVLPPLTVSIYDSLLCLNKVGQGTPADFMAAGLESILPPNMTSTLYAKVVDAAGNQSSCTYMTDYTYVNVPPGKPIFASSTPATPSFTARTNVKGTVAASSNFLAIAAVNLYSDAACTSLMSTGSQSDWQGAGITVDMGVNATTTLYGQTVDPVGNPSLCNALVNYVHSNVPPSNLSATLRPDGAVNLNWTPVSGANPIPVYIVKRSTVSGGPYTILVSDNPGSSYTDKAVQNGKTYYYVVAATNNTGTSLNSAEVSVTIAPPNPAAATSLVATPGDSAVTLAWTGFNSDMSFAVLRSTQRGGPYTRIANELNSMSYMDTAVTVNVPYYYVIVGSNPAGLSSHSNEASAVPLGTPDAPTDLQLTPLLSTPACGGGAGVLLTWSSTSYYTNFVIKRSWLPGSSTFYANSGTTSYTDCYPLTFYSGGADDSYYTVAAAWGTNESANSNEVSFVNDAQPVVTVRPGDGENFITWTNPTAASSFRLLRSQVSGGPYSVLVASTTAGQYLDTGVSNGQPYYYVIEAFYGTKPTWPSIEASGVPGAAPAAPTNLSLTVDTAKKPAMSWTAPANYNMFNVYRASAPGGPYTLLSASNTAQFTDTSPLAGMNYYKVSALWGTLETAFSNTVSFRHGVPASLTALPSGSNIALSWSGVAGAADYTVYRSFTSGGPYSPLATSATSTYTDTTTAPGLGYYYVVAANFADATSGQYSSEASAMESGSTVPGGLTVVSTTGGSVTLAWAKFPNAATYRIRRATTPTGTYTQVATGVTGTTTTLGSLLSQTTYYFKVQAVVSGTPTALSSYIGATTLTGPTAPGALPGDSSVQVQWASVSGALSYGLDRSTDGVNWTTLATGIPSISYTDNSVTNGVLYYYRISASYASGTQYSTASAAVTPGITPLVPAAPTVVDNTSGVDIKVSWPKVSGTTTYNLYLATSSGGPYGAPVLMTSSTVNNVVPALTPGTTYYLALSALNGSLESAKSPETVVHVVGQPPAPSVIAASGSSFTVSWPAVGGAATYDLQRADDGVTFATIAPGLAVTTYLDATVSSQNSYSYRYLPVRAGGIPMAVSGASGLSTSGIAPLPPSAFQALATSTTSVKLDWVQVPNASQYRLYRGTSSGGPYSVLATIPSSNTTYTDSTAAAGQTYYYVATSLNIAGAESVYSNQEAVSTVAGPATLNASVGANVNNISWAAAAGAVSYIVRRSEISGGPYGVVGSGIAGTSFQDANVEHGHIYYYVADAVFASGAVSVHSPEGMATASNTMNLEVPVELTDQGLGSTSAPVVFERTRTSLDTNDYDGTVAYFLDATVANYDAAPAAISLVNSSGTAVGTLNVPGSTSVPARMRVAVTPTAGANEYRLRLDATPMTGTLQVFIARLVIVQTGASRTKIYFPLLASGALPNESDFLASAQSLNATAFASLPVATPYRRDVSSLANIADYNAWTLETLVAAGPGTEGSVALYNTTNAAVVPGTESIFSNGAITLVQASIDEGATGFGTANNGQDFEVALKCNQGCGSDLVHIYKAGLWVTLTDLSKAQVIYRTSLGLPMVSSPAVNENGRTLLNLASYSNPTVSAQAAGYILMGSGPVTARLNTDGANDSGTSALSPVAGADFSFSVSNKTVSVTPQLTIPSGQRLLLEIDPAGSTFNLNSSALVIRSAR